VSDKATTRYELVSSFNKKKIKKEKKDNAYNKHIKSTLFTGKLLKINKSLV
jgi:hypothetical protein